jgi:pseudaminic acid biosynthesis-associated methylase
MTNFKTLQEDFWAGNFGDEYIDRNKGNHFLASNIALFAKILAYTYKVKSLIEFGANIGLNLLAIQQLIPGVELSAVEINKNAVESLHKIKGLKVFPMSILDFSPESKRDFVFTKGLLIHINPDVLPKVYDILHQTSQKYICIIEYYNPTPVTVSYRGHQDKLFKRDFAGELLERYPDVKLVTYGFVYRRDHNFYQDDLTWFLLEKQSQK